MATITLVQAATHDANAIAAMTAMPMGVHLTGLAGGAIQFTCTNALAAIQGARSVSITYDAAHGSGHQVVQVSSVMS